MPGHVNFIEKFYRAHILLLPQIINYFDRQNTLLADRKMWN